jgi:uncharacterized protein
VTSTLALSLCDPTAHTDTIGNDWMSATGMRPFFYDDPVLIWLKYHGKQHGYTPDTSEYSFLGFLARKGYEFEQAWLERMLPDAVTVCTDNRDVYRAERVRETLTLMEQGVPAIAQAALWWPEELIYGIADLLIHTSRLRDLFPAYYDALAAAGHVGDDLPDYYIVCDLKFSSNLDSSKKKQDHACYAGQVRLYTYILGHMQGVLPPCAYLIARDRIAEPLVVTCHSVLHDPLDDDLADKRDRYIDIKLNGAHYLPWRDEIVASNYRHTDEVWRKAKDHIAQERLPGGDIRLMYKIQERSIADLARHGFATFAAIQQACPDSGTLAQCKGIGAKTATQMHAVLRANKDGKSVPLPVEAVPERKRFEFYVDFEFFINTNVDFAAQWPTLDGCEMIFMIGVGWETDGVWRYQQFTAHEESHAAEQAMLSAFLDFLMDETGGAFPDPASTALYHWYAAEPRQAQGAAARHGWSSNHPLLCLPWFDLQKLCTEHAVGIPGAWDFGLKNVAKALAQVDPVFDPHWPGSLCDGMTAMVMGWYAYQQPEPLACNEMETIGEYLEADCRALRSVLTWMRAEMS